MFLLRHQLNIALRRAPKRQRLNVIDRTILVWIVRLWADLVEAIQVVKPETMLRWHRAGLQVLLALEIAKEGRPTED